MSPRLDLDFTSSLYLGLRHPSRALAAFPALTAGAPAAVTPPPGAAHLAAGLARLIGCEAATLGTSTLHLFVDLLPLLARRGMAVVMAGDVYPIARWSVDRARALGAPVIALPKGQPRQLDDAVRRLARSGRRAAVVTDGLAIPNSTPAPLAAYLQIVRSHGGLLVVDDTQALGLLGGGGGSLRWHGIGGPEIVVVDSLAKGLGVPLAVLAGSRALVRSFEARSETRIHCSAPNAAAIAAGLRALAINRTYGDRLRRELLRNVTRFRAGLRRIGLAADGGLLPVQTLRAPGALDVGALQRRLVRQGIKTLVLQPEPDAGPRLAFVLTARHRREDIDRAISALNESLQLHGRATQDVRLVPASSKSRMLIMRGSFGRYGSRALQRNVFRNLMREASGDSIDYVGEIPPDVSRALFFYARMLWQVRGALLYQFVNLARSLVMRRRLPPLKALHLAARHLNIPRKARGRGDMGRVTPTQVKAMRRKMRRLPRHKDPRLRHSYRGRRFEEMFL